MNISWSAPAAARNSTTGAATRSSPLRWIETHAPLLLFTLCLLCGSLGAARGAEPPPAAAGCIACHGGAGVPRAAGVPVIDGQTEGYLYVELRDYARGVRGDAAMQPIAAALSRDEMAALATYFAALPWPSRRLRLDDAERKAARLLARGGQCTQCHLAGYLGAGTAPRLAGQSAAYLRATMLAFRSGARANNAAMSALLGRQSDAAIATLAAYLAAFQP